MYLKKIFTLKPTFVLLSAMTLLSGCSTITDKLVYRININQGNYVEQKSVSQLQKGMSKAQVRYVLGSPMLVENGYPDTWYYIYYHVAGHESPQQKNLILKFNPQGKLASLSGDFKPGNNFNLKTN